MYLEFPVHSRQHKNKQNITLDLRCQNKFNLAQLAHFSHCSNQSIPFILYIYPMVENQHFQTYTTLHKLQHTVLKLLYWCTICQLVDPRICLYSSYEPEVTCFLRKLLSVNSICNIDQTGTILETGSIEENELMKLFIYLK